MLEWLRRLAAAQPRLLLVEDLQWSDPSTAELLGRIAADPPPGALIVLTSRSEPAEEWRHALVDLPLGRLTDEDARLLRRRPVRRHADHRAARRHRRSGRGHAAVPRGADGRRAHRRGRRPADPAERALHQPAQGTRRRPAPGADGGDDRRVVRGRSPRAWWPARDSTSKRACAACRRSASSSPRLDGDESRAAVPSHAPAGRRLRDPGARHPAGQPRPGRRRAGQPALGHRVASRGHRPPPRPFGRAPRGHRPVLRGRRPGQQVRRQRRGPGAGGAGAGALPGRCPPVSIAMSPSSGCGCCGCCVPVRSRATAPRRWARTRSPSRSCAGRSRPARSPSPRSSSSGASRSRRASSRGPPAWWR